MLLFFFLLAALLIRILHLTCIFYLGCDDAIVDGCVDEMFRVSLFSLELVHWLSQHIICKLNRAIVNAPTVAEFIRGDRQLFRVKMDCNEHGLVKSHLLQ